MKIGMISGHKIPDLLKNPERIIVETPYGDIPVEISRLGKHEIFFINRHGPKSNLPPHKVNYLGNIQAFASSRVGCILSISTVGSINKSIHAGDFVIPHDFIDFTKSRLQTFYSDKRVHVDMTDPYCSSLRDELVKSCKQIKNIRMHGRGVYLSTEGPRLETVSEIQFFSKYADIVGMTGVPEVVLAREKGLCYATLCVVCNMAAGLQKKLTTDEISKLYKLKQPVIAKILKTTVESIREKQKTCCCKKALDKASL
jgi:5'-methylthioadenosine phosphorylase